MKNNLKRGQAAMEFLSTYGWAVLIIALVLAALLWLGVFNVQQGIPERCTFQAGLECSDVRLTGSTSASPVYLSQITLRNRMANTLYICSISCSNDLQAATTGAPAAIVTPAECATSGEVAILQSGQKQTIVLSSPSQCADYFAGSLSTNIYKAGDTYSGSIAVYYSLASDVGVSGAKARMAAGEVYYKVTEG